jgi:hypothetical protein
LEAEEAEALVVLEVPHHLAVGQADQAKVLVTTEQAA